MNDDFSAAILASWSISFWPTALLLLTLVLYLRGFRLAVALRPRELPTWRMISFLGGITLLWLAISSPLDALGEFLLVAHMTQHLLLMSVVPPLLLLGAPAVPLLRGLPRFLIREVVAGWVSFPPFRRLGSIVSRPLFGWMAMNLSYLIWHFPAMYELALRSNEWHYLEHACFLSGSLAFWWHVIRPWPAHSRRSAWSILPYLVLADIVNTIISASLAFSSKVVYPTYALAPRLFEISALEDQVAAGAEMWVLGSMISLIPILVIVVSQLSGVRSGKSSAPESGRKTPPPPFDLLRVPLAGWLLRQRHGRLFLQAGSFLLLALLIFHGLRGTPLSALNLAGGLLWTLLRPLFFLLLLTVANLFCMACPFTFPRELARRFWTPRFHWPSWLRGKWIAALLTILFFWFYLQFDLWNWPSATAWILIAYVAAALAVDLLFQGASFCRYICPIGQFNFLTTLAAPLEIGAKENSVCQSCAGHDCLRGNAAQRGCELQLFLPTKSGNLDCTLCMDCVKACPADNVQIVLHPPLRVLTGDPLRSSLRRLAQRVDIAVLALLLTGFALANAAAMTAPVLQWTDSLRQPLAWLRHPALTLVATLLASILIVLLFQGLAALLVKIAPAGKRRMHFCRLSLALLPLGLALWAAHFLFHLTTAGGNLAPVLDQFLSDAGWQHVPAFAAASADLPAALCSPRMLMLARGGGGTSLLSLQLWILDAGLLLTLYLFWRLARDLGKSAASRTLLLVLSSLPALCCYAAGVWIFSQPMQMLGMGGQ
jgi:cytochrome c oxidase assembly factor CtaG/polyferredoxin